MPSSTNPNHARSHALLLLQKLLNLRDSASPLTLILDTLEQSGKPVIREFLNRGKIAKSKIIFISYSTVRKPPQADVFIRARGKTCEALHREVISHYPSGANKTLLIIDTLNPLCSSSSTSSTLPLPLFLSSLITSPSISLVATYHLDVPCSSLSSFSQRQPGGGRRRSSNSNSSSSSSSSKRRTTANEYSPDPLTLLLHLSTAILRVSDPRQVLSRKRARDRSLQEPEWGLGEEGREGVLVGLKGIMDSDLSPSEHGKGSGAAVVVLEMELRRRSGRSVVETFLLLSPPPSPSSISSQQQPPGKLSLLSDHPSFSGPPPDPSVDDSKKEGAGTEGDGGDQPPESTFSLGLTEKERRDRDAITLPYFDAQTDIGGGEGGRILYEMGREDDFDDEEDEI